MSRKNFCMTTLSLYSITSSKHDRFFFLGMSVRIRRIIWCSNRLMICIIDPLIHVLYCPSSGCNGMECHFSMRLERSCRCLVVLNVPSVMVTGVVGLSHCMLVEGLDVHRTYCFSRYLGCDQHPAATGYWCSKGHWFNDSWLGISVVSHLDFLLPVDSDMYGSVVSHWRSVLVYPDAH